MNRDGEERWECRDRNDERKKTRAMTTFSMISLQNKSYCYCRDYSGKGYGELE